MSDAQAGYNDIARRHWNAVSGARSGLKIGTKVRYEGGTGTIDRTSKRTGVKLYRVADRWFERSALTAI